MKACRSTRASACCAWPYWNCCAGAPAARCRSARVRRVNWLPTASRCTKRCCRSPRNCANSDSRRRPMGRTMPSITQAFLEEEQAFNRFRRALRSTDQQALDDLFASARQHLAAAAYASHALPMETFLLSMLLEQHKEVLRLRHQLEALRSQFNA